MIYYVSASVGNDSNTGNLDSPFLTIQHAADLANPGDFVYVFPGIYRERISPPRGGVQGSPIIYKGIIDASGNRPIVRGSCPWKPTMNDMPGIWSDVLDMGLFTDKSHIDGGCPFDVPFSVTPYGQNGLPEYKMNEPMSPVPDPTISYCLGQVWVSQKENGEPGEPEQYKQVPRISDLMQTEKTWNYNSITRVLTVHFPTDTNIDKYEIEITNQRRLFCPHLRGLKYIHVTGFTFERCGNNYPNQFWMVPQNQQAGAVGTRSGKYWTIDNNIIRHATGIGIDWGNEGAGAQDLEIPYSSLNNGAATGSYGHIISNNLICDNGAAGTASYMCKKFTFIHNEVTRNNAYRFYGKRRWESAGLKVHCPTDSMVVNNHIYDNYCHGIWCDQGISNGVFDSNTLTGNLGSGLNTEIGKGTSGLVTNCIFENNECGITLVTSGGITIRGNRFLGSKQADIQTIIFNRTADKWDSDNVRIMSNEFISKLTPVFLSLTPKDANVSTNRYMNNNAYFCEPEDKKFVIGKTAYNFENWRTQWDLANGGVDCDKDSKLSYK